MASASQLASAEVRQGARFGLPGDEYEVGEELGAGAASRVFACRHLRTGERLAVKAVDLRRLRLLGDRGDQLGRLDREVSILSELRHERIVNLCGFHHTENWYFLVMELVAGGELFDLIVRRRSLCEIEARHVFRQLLEGVGYMHARHIIHRDLKPENILVASSRPAYPSAAADGGRVVPQLYEVKIADFGLSKVVGGVASMAKTCVGTPQYWAPEVLEVKHKGGCYDQAADFWGLGAVLYVMLSGRYPFDGKKAPLEEQIRTAAFTTSGPRWKAISEEAKSLVRGLLQVDPAKRMTLEDCLAHPWMMDSVVEFIQSVPTPPSRSSAAVLDGEVRPEARERQDEEEVPTAPLGPGQSAIGAVPSGCRSVEAEDEEVEEVPVSPVQLQGPPRVENAAEELCADEHRDAEELDELPEEGGGSAGRAPAAPGTAQKPKSAQGRYRGVRGRGVGKAAAAAATGALAGTRMAGARDMAVATETWGPSTSSKAPCLNAPATTPPWPATQPLTTSRSAHTSQGLGSKTSSAAWFMNLPRRIWSWLLWLTCIGLLLGAFAHHATGRIVLRGAGDPNCPEHLDIGRLSSRDSRQSSAVSPHLQGPNIFADNMGTGAGGSTSAPPSAPPAGACTEQETIFRLTELLRLQVSISGSLAMAFLAFRHADVDLAEAAQETFNEARDLFQSAADVVRRFSEVARQVRNTVLPDLQLAVEEQEPALAASLLDVVKGWVADMKSDGEAMRIRYGELQASVLSLSKRAQRKKWLADQRLAAAVAKRSSVEPEAAADASQEEAPEEPAAEGWTIEVESATEEFAVAAAGTRARKAEVRESRGPGLEVCGLDATISAFVDGTAFASGPGTGKTDSWQTNVTTVYLNKLTQHLFEQLNTESTTMTLAASSEGFTEPWQRSVLDLLFLAPGVLPSALPVLEALNFTAAEPSRVIVPEQPGEEEVETATEDSQSETNSTGQALVQYVQDAAASAEFSKRSAAALLRALRELRRVDSILQGCSAFWSNMDGTVRRLAQMKELTERLVRFAKSSPRIRERFDQRLGEYASFWLSLEQLCRQYSIDHQAATERVQDFLRQVADAADIVDTASSAQVGAFAAKRKKGRTAGA